MDKDAKFSVSILCLMLVVVLVGGGLVYIEGYEVTHTDLSESVESVAVSSGVADLSAQLDGDSDIVNTDTRVTVLNEDEERVLSTNLAPSETKITQESIGGTGTYTIIISNGEVHETAEFTVERRGIPFL